MSNATPGAFGSVDLAEVISALNDACGAVAEDFGHELVLDLPTDHRLTLRGDRELLTQMFANLSRTRSATAQAQPGSRSERRKKTGAAAAFVDDNGTRIAPAERGKVFSEALSLGKQPHDRRLRARASIVKAVADLHYATVTLRDNGPGLLVQVSFPPIEAP